MHSRKKKWSHRIIPSMAAPFDYTHGRPTAKERLARNSALRIADLVRDKLFR